MRKALQTGARIQQKGAAAAAASQIRCSHKKEVPRVLLDKERTTRAPEEARFGKRVHEEAHARKARQSSRAKTMVDRFEERVNQETYADVDAPPDPFASKLALPQTLSPPRLGNVANATGVLLEPQDEVAYLSYTITSKSSAPPSFIRAAAVEKDLWKEVRRRDVVPECGIIQTSYWDASAHLPERTKPKRLPESRSRQRYLSETALPMISSGATPEQALITDGSGKQIYQTLPHLPMKHKRSGGDFPQGWDMNIPGAIYSVYDRFRQKHGWGIFHLGGSKDTNFLTMLNWSGEAGRPTTKYWKDRLMEAYELRALLLNMSTTTAYRLVNGAADGIPGVIVDIYGSVAVVCLEDPPHLCYSAVRDFLEDLEIHHVYLQDTLGRAFLANALETDVELTNAEKSLPLPNYVALPSPHWAQGGVSDCTFHENGMKFLWQPDLPEGTFTGHYLQHRTVRQLIMSLSHGKSVLDLCAFNGSMGIAALCGGARQVTFVEVDEDYCKLIGRNLSLQMPEEEWRKVCRVECNNVQEMDMLARFDIVVVDPPDITFEDVNDQISDTQYNHIEHTLRVASNRVRRGGKVILVHSSRLCPIGWVAKAVGKVAIRSGLSLTVLRTVTLPPDFPQDSQRNQGLYLAVVLEVSEPLYPRQS